MLRSQTDRLDSLLLNVARSDQVAALNFDLHVGDLGATRRVLPCTWLLIPVEIGDWILDPPTTTLGDGGPDSPTDEDPMEALEFASLHR